MKKILLAVALVLALGLGANAQYNNGSRDSFFNDWSDYDNGLLRENEPTTLFPTLPGHGLEDNTDAPLGSGLLILTALGAGYAISRRKK